MEKEDVIEKINHTFIENFEIEPEKLTKETKLFEDLELDSLDAVDMIVHMEQNLGICLLYTSPSPRDKRQSRMPSSA